MRNRKIKLILLYILAIFAWYLLLAVLMMATNNTTVNFALLDFMVYFMIFAVPIFTVISLLIIYVKLKSQVDEKQNLKELVKGSSPIIKLMLFYMLAMCIGYVLPFIAGASYGLYLSVYPIYLLIISPIYFSVICIYGIQKLIKKHDLSYFKMNIRKIMPILFIYLVFTSFNTFCHLSLYGR